MAASQAVQSPEAVDFMEQNLVSGYPICDAGMPLQAEFPQLSTLTSP
jgi:hypothetical protein